MSQTHLLSWVTLATEMAWKGFMWPRLVPPALPPLQNHISFLSFPSFSSEMCWTGGQNTYSISISRVVESGERQLVFLEYG